MNHSDVMRVLSDPVAQYLFNSPLLAHFAYAGSDGFPRVVPVGYLWKGDRFVICTPANAPKVAALTINPKVALSIDSVTQPPRVLLVRGVASIEVVDGIPAEFLEASSKSLTAEERPGFTAQARSLYKQMARIWIEPKWAKVIDFETRLPVAIEELATGRSQRRL